MTDTIQRQVLRNAIALLKQPGAWTSEVEARDAQGTECDPEAPEARSWCAVGALLRAGFDLGLDPVKAMYIMQDIDEACTEGEHSLSQINEVFGYDKTIRCMELYLMDAAIPAAGGHPQPASPAKDGNSPAPG